MTKEDQTTEVQIDVLNVFTDADGNGGNPVGIVVDEKNQIDAITRQKIAAETGYSETVFVGHVKSGAVSIFNPIAEVLFAGHAVLGAFYYLKFIQKQDLNRINSQGKSFDCWQEGRQVWVRSSIDLLPPWDIEQRSTPEEIEALEASDFDSGAHILVWSWLNEQAGLVRARTFAPAWGIPEDEANGSGCMCLASVLQMGIEVQHGVGSLIHAKPSADSLVEVGGRVKVSRSYAIDLKPFLTINK